MSCMIVSLLSGFITSTNILLRILFIFNFSISAGIFRKFYYCTIFCSTFSWDLLFLSCSDFIFLKQKRHFIISFTDLVDFIFACESVEVFTHTKKKNYESRQQHSLFTAEKHAATWLFMFFTFHRLYKLNRCWSRPSFFIFVKYDNVWWTDCLHFLLLLIQRKGSYKVKNTKADSKHEVNLTVNVELKIIYIKVKLLYKRFLLV